jgi:protein SCO1/2
MRRNKSLVLVALAASLISAITLIHSRPASADDKRWGADYFPNVPLVDQDGKTVHFYDDLIKGKSVVLDMIYTHCVDSCPLETARLVQVQKILGDKVGKDVFFYSITIDPKRDTPKVLKQYAETYHVGPGWTFYTGKPADIELIAKKLGLYSDPDPTNRDGHQPGVLIGNEPSHQWMLDAATDNPRFMSIMISDWLNSWRNRKGTPLPSYTEATTVQKDGRYLFARHCAACHTIGHGDKIGPDLLGVVDVRDHAWLVRQIATPDEMLASKDPIATTLWNKYKHVNMPNLRLDQDEVSLIIDFLKDPSAQQSKDPSKLDLVGAHGH